MAEKFTPGEWRAEIEDHSFCDTGDYITEFGVVTGKRQTIAQCFDTGSINEEEAAANCYLIAAAPEMYEFVKMFTSAAGQFLLSHADNGKEIYNEAVRILKKARGEE